MKFGAWCFPKTSIEIGAWCFPTNSIDIFGAWCFSENSIDIGAWCFPKNSIELCLSYAQPQGIIRLISLIIYYIYISPSPRWGGL